MGITRMQTKQLKQAADVLNTVGWFVPPYVGVGLIETVAHGIMSAQGQFTEDDLETILASIYSPDRLAAMVINRYHRMPVIELYQETISEAIAAHFSGFRHVAVGGLIPAVEGIGRELARQRGLKADGAIKAVFDDLLKEANSDVVNRRVGAIQEIVDMLDAFLHFLKEYFFKDSRLYWLLDKTNRHGILHGAYKDADYGRPINFYKTISAIDILTFVSMLKTTKMSGFAPSQTSESNALAEHYRRLQQGS